MLDFINLIRIAGDRFSIQADINADFTEMFNRSLVSNNSRCLMQVKAGGEIYFIDLNRMFVKHTELLISSTIQELIDQITPEMLYAYMTNSFSHSKVVRSFTDGDLPGDINVTPYSIAVDETSNVTDDPAYRDLKITCSNYDLSKVIPVIDGKLRKCMWHNGRIYIEGGADLVRAAHEITFLSFGECDVSVVSLAEVKANDWHIDEECVPILVLDGALFYDTNYMYHFSRERHSLKLTEQFVMSNFSKYGFTSVDEVINSVNSFVILVKANNIYLRDIPVMKMTPNKTPPFVYFEFDTWRHHTDYIAIDSTVNRVVGFTAVDEKYKKVTSADGPKEHHIYVQPEHSDINLIQMVVC